MIAQDYSLTFDGDNKFCCGSVAMDEDENVLFFNTDFQEERMFLTEVIDGNFNDTSIEIFYEDGDGISLASSENISTVFSNDNLIFQFSRGGREISLFKYNNITKRSEWSYKIIAYVWYNHLFYNEELNKIYSTQTVVFNNDPFSGSISVLALSGSGKIEWQKVYKHNEDNVDFWVFSKGLTATNSNIYFLMSQINLYGLVKLELDGTVSSAIQFQDRILDGLKLGRNGELYIYGKSTELSEETRNNRNGIIIKLNEDLEIIWSKLLVGEAFEYRDLAIQTTDKGLVFAYSTNGYFPVIMGELNHDGDLISVEGQSFFNPNVYVGKRGSIFLNQNVGIKADGTFEAETSLMKIQLNKTNLDCAIYDACLEVIDLKTSSTPLTFEVKDIDLIERDSVYTRTASLATSDYCLEIDTPSANFEMPDTVCINTCIEPTNIFNEYAHAVRWEQKLDNTYLLISEDLQPSLCFENVGISIVKQTVWYLGCPHQYEKEITVIDLSLTTIDIEGDTCNTETDLLMNVNFQREPTSFVWSTGSTSKEISVVEDGIYSVTYTDKFCGESTVEIEVDRYRISKEDIIDFNSKDTICSAALPYFLAPESLYDNVFNLKDEAPSNVVSISNFGEHIIYTKFNNCTYQKSFVLESKDCEATVYVPNVFSPNADGINDFIGPLGDNFEVESFKIYNRWGAVLYASSEESFFWDGHHKNELVEPSLLVYVLNFTNTITREAQILKGSITLMR